LNQLAAEAKAATDAGQIDAAIASWTQAINLLPRESRQYAAIVSKVEELTRQLTASASNVRHKWRHRATSGRITGIGGLFLFLLAGLTKASTFWTMLLSVGVYWQAYGWKLAVGLVLSIYIHEMGHVAMLLRYGVPASAPMFVPGLGAMIMLKQHPSNPREDARIGLAGPLWGLAAALLSSAGWFAFHWPSWAAIAQLGAFLNLFNLTPIWQLDGSRAFRALSRIQRVTLIVVIGAVYGVVCYHRQHWWGFHTMLILVGGIGLLRTLSEPKPELEGHGDRVALAQCVVLIIALTLLSIMYVPGIEPSR
jgi:Zn-dependent protease